MRSLAILLLLTGPVMAEDQIPCWQAKALLTWSLGNEAKAEKMARKYYSKAQIAEVRERCKL